MGLLAALNALFCFNLYTYDKKEGLAPADRIRVKTSTYFKWGFLAGPEGQGQDLFDLIKSLF